MNSLKKNKIPIKIAVVIDSWFPAIGGGQINAWEISRRLASRDLQIDIITRNSGKDNSHKIKYLSINKFGSKSDPQDPVSKILFTIWLLPFLMSKDYDLIHVHPFLPAIALKLVSLVKKTPIILTVHGTRLFESKLSLSPSRVLEWFILTKIKYDLVISVTQAFKKIRNANYNIKVIPNGVDFEKFHKVKIKKATYPKIIWVGRFDKVKRVENLIIAMKYVIKKVPDAKLALIGYGWEEKNLRNLTKKLKLNNHIEFKGKKLGVELIRQYKSSHLFVLCSDSEGQPLSVLQAQTASLPVVATKTGGIPEIVKDKLNGLLVPPNDYQFLANAIIWCLRNKNNFGKIGHTMVGKMNNWDNIAKKTLSVYKRLSK